MPTLPELQYGFRRHLLEEPDEALASAVLGDGMTPDARLRIYRNHVAYSLRAALATTFPVVVRLVGEEFFGGMTRPFIARHPPRSPCLHEYGDQFPDFVADFAPAASLPYLPDVGRLEWAMNAAYHADAERPLDAAILLGLDPASLAQIRLRLQPAVGIVDSAYPVDTIWRANQADGDGSGVDLATGPRSLLVWRQDNDAVFRQLDPGGSVFVGGLLSGESMAMAAEGALAAASDFDLAGALQLLLGQGLVADIAA